MRSIKNRITGTQQDLFNDNGTKMSVGAPALISACLCGIPCRWHGRRPKKRTALIESLNRRFVLIPICPEQLGGMPTPRSGEYLDGHTGAEVLDGAYRVRVPGTQEDVTQYYLNGAQFTFEIAEVTGAKVAYMKGGSPSCDKIGVTGEFLQRRGIRVIRVP